MESMPMSEQLKASAKLAREFLEMVAGGIGKVESGAGDLKRLGLSTASDLARRMPAKWRNVSPPSTNVIATLVVAGIVASTAALIYSRMRDSRSSSRRRRRR
jgi:hypothetical protein